MKNFEGSPIDGVLEVLNYVRNSIDNNTKSINKLRQKITHDEDGELIDRFYTIKEVSSIVGLSEYYVRQDIKDGMLKPLERGGKNVITKKQLQEYLDR